MKLNRTINGINYTVDGKVSEVGDSYFSSDGRLLMWTKELKEMCDNHVDIFNEIPNTPDKVVACEHVNEKLIEFIKRVEEEYEKVNFPRRSAMLDLGKSAEQFFKSQK